MTKTHSLIFASLEKRPWLEEAKRTKQIWKLRWKWVVMVLEMKEKKPSLRLEVLEGAAC